MAEAENSRQKAFEETIKCRKAEKRATEAILRVKFKMHSILSFLILL